MQSFGDRFIIGGDFNSKHTHWDSLVTTTKGKELLKAANELKCDFLFTRKPTYYPAEHGKLPNSIDFFIIRKLSLDLLSIKDGYDLSADHSPVYLTIHKTAAEKVYPPFLSNWKTNWTLFRQILSSEVFFEPSKSDEIKD